MAGYVRQDTLGNIATGNIIDANDFNNEFNAIVAAFSASSGHKHDGTTAEGSPITVIGPAQDFVASSLSLVPKTTDEYSLGTSLLKWSSGHFSNTVYALTYEATNERFVGGGTNVILAPATGTGIAGTVRLRPKGSGDPSSQTVITDDGAMLVNGNITSTGDIVGATLTGNLAATNITGTIASARISGIYSGITGTGVLNSGSISSGFGNVNIGTSTFTGNGSGLTTLNASNLSSGTVPNARISGAYSGITDLTMSGALNASDPFNVVIGAANRIQVTVNGLFVNSSTRQIAAFNNNSAQINNPLSVFGGLTVEGVIAHSSGNLSLRTGTSSTNRLTVSNSGISVSGAVDATSFSGNGSSITALNMNNASSGTLSIARGGTGSGTASGARTSLGLGTMATRNTGTGSSDHRTNSQMDARYHISGQTLSADDLPTNTDSVNWVRNRITSMSTGSVGTYAFLSQNSGGPTSVGPGSTWGGSELLYSNAAGNGLGGSSSPSGTWRAMYYSNSSSAGANGTGVWMRINSTEILGHRGPYKYVSGGRIDCEVNYARHGWHPCTVDENDEQTAALFAQLINSDIEIEPYVEPEPEEASLSRKQWDYMLAIGGLRTPIRLVLDAMDQNAFTTEERTAFAELEKLILHSDKYYLSEILGLVSANATVIENVLGSVPTEEQITQAFNAALEV